MCSQSALSNLDKLQGNWKELILFYNQIRKHGFEPNTFTFPLLLKACSSSQPPLLHQGQAIHADATKRGFQSDTYVTTAIVSMYARCGSLVNARKVFDEIPQRGPVCWNVAISSFFHAGDCEGARKLFEGMREPNVVTWSAMIAGYTQNERAHDALSIFKKMRQESNDDPNSDTMASVLSACVKLRCFSFGQQVHGFTVKMSKYIELDVFVGSVLVDFYGRCSCMEFARCVFDSMLQKCVVAWSILIANYLRNECPFRVIEVFKEMVYRGVKPNYVTLTTLITACAHTSNLRIGKELHGFVVRRRPIRSDVFVSTSLVDMYGKCHCMAYAHRVFEKDNTSLGHITTPMWNALIAGYADNGLFGDAWRMVQSLCRLPDGGPKLNSVTMAIVLPLCARSALFPCGKELHCYALRYGLDEEIFVGNGLLDMYSKCGKIQWATRQFNKMAKKNRISWTSMIDGYGMHGDGEAAIKVFQSMVGDNNVAPDHITFVALISACSHAGLVEEGFRYFEAMKQEYGIKPMEENYGCVVDLLARAGRIDEAKDLIAKMPMKPSASVFGALLGACRIHGDVDEAEFAAQYLLELEPKEPGFRTLLSHIYAERGRLDGVTKVRRGMREMGVEKRAGCSWLETKERICGPVGGG